MLLLLRPSLAWRFVTKPPWPRMVSSGIFGTKEGFLGVIETTFHVPPSLHRVSSSRSFDVPSHLTCICTLDNANGTGESGTPSVS